MTAAPAAAATGRAAERPGILWETSAGLVDHGAAVTRMEALVAEIAQGRAPERVWLLEHDHVYTAGTAAGEEDRAAPGVPVVRTGRGGKLTYHGPGQRVVYPMLDLGRRGRDVRRYVDALERWVIDALDRLGVAAFTAPGRVGVWTRDGGAEAKIAAIGVRVRRWVSFHGVAINAAPDLARFGAIVPCGLRDFGVTSLAALGAPAGLAGVDAALEACFPRFLERLGGGRA